jgi:hypothetical protein
MQAPFGMSDSKPELPGLQSGMLKIELILSLYRKKKIIASYIRKFGKDRVKSHIWRKVSSYLKKCGSLVILEEVAPNPSKNNL